ncbi:MAG: hypothetical protein EOO87_17580 [Pedobacter sp.]|nr:MAG: hypothetical protein EOO87_17580 [Pedobacter sp.]
MDVLKLANLFQPGMIIQQNKPLKIWGRAIPFKKITVRAGWLQKINYTVTDENGDWLITVKVPGINPGNFSLHNITVTDGTETIELNNVAIGEVWIAAGQSNMQYRMNCEEGKVNGVIDYEQEIAAANYPHIRMFYVELNFKYEPYNEVQGKWVSCTPETVANFSGVGYYFARELHLQLNIPVGIILSNIGASLSEAWTSRKVLEGDEILFKNCIKPFDECLLSKEELDDGFTFEKVTRPTLLYNAMIYPLRNFSIKGFIWYHGELNRNDRQNYLRLIKGMITGWRKDFGQGDLPFYFVQQPPYFWDREDETNFDYAIFREFQAKTRELPNVEMAVTIDDNQPRKLHPKNKKMVGVRLANIALNKNYNLKHIPYLGPQVEKTILLDDTFKLTYSKNTLYGGLTTSDNQPAKHFEIAGNDNIFYPAKAAIVNNNIFVSSHLVTKPVALRYAFTNTAVTNLVNKCGLPAEPFRTDNYEKVKIITMANHKGGAGKSTLALNLYNYFATTFKTVIVDVDANGSLYRLKDYHPQLNIINELDMFKIAKLPYQIIIIDTPPTNIHYLDGLLSISDFVLIPVKTSLFDIMGLDSLIKQVLNIQGRNASKSGVVMNRVKTLTGDNSEIRNYLKSLSMRLLDTVVTDRVSFNKSPVTAGIINTYDKKANAEIASLGEEILRILG